MMRGEARVAEEDVEAHRQDGDDCRLREQREGIRRENGRERAGEDHGDGPGDDSRVGCRTPGVQARPKRPVGRSARISAIGAKSVK